MHSRQRIQCLQTLKKEHEPLAIGINSHQRNELTANTKMETYG